MVIVDANAILRYILSDNMEMAEKVEKLILMNIVHIRYEVIAEVVYVLDKVYSLSREEIEDGIKIFLSTPNVVTESEDVLILALETYAEKRLDFVDCLLYSFKIVNNYDIFTFDK